MKHKLLKSIFALVTVVALFTISGCSQSSPALGTFTFVSAEYRNEALDAAEVYSSEVILELNEDGKGFLHFGEESGLISWTLSGSELKLVLNKQQISGIYENNSLVLSIPEKELSLNFVRLGVEADEDASDNLVQSYYGWWDIGDAGGQWQEYKEMWFDSCAVIETDESGNGYFIMWDEDSSYEKPICRIQINMQDDAISVEKGAFLNCIVTDDNWKFNTDATDYPDMMVIELAYSDDNGFFNSVMYFRPWGIEWNDVQEKAPDLLPYYYEEWYLPLIEAGSQMPGAFELN